MSGYWPFIRYVIQTYGVFIGTTFLGLVTAVSVIVVYKGIRKERKIELDEKKLTEAYTPLLDRLSKATNKDPVEYDKDQIGEAIKILHSKDFLFHPDILNACPGHDKSKVEEWKNFYHEVWKEREKLLKEYLKWIGVKKFADLIELPPDISSEYSFTILKK